eukprot:TRINITY_DN66253_c0_g1_i1.p1 TRINITY_DN66253_c0_g1~~TRINITY_DN66253_c0_g1_i1.p1  ORF type:complete len:247 (-),score=21.73 TRINITY_DN66253_c0_g1_i1:71-811(-)
MHVSSRIQRPRARRSYRSVALPAWSLLAVALCLLLPGRRVAFVLTKPWHGWYASRYMPQQRLLVLPRHSSPEGRALPPSYNEIAETVLSDMEVDFRTLQQELLADSWTDSTLPVALIKRDGGTKIQVQEWQESQSRIVSYQLPVLPGGIGVRVENTYTLRDFSDTSMRLELVSVTYAPVIQNLRVHTCYQMTLEGDAAKLQVGGFSEWVKTPPPGFASPIEKGIKKSQAASCERFKQALEQSPSTR